VVPGVPKTSLFWIIAILFIDSILFSEIAQRFNVAEAFEFIPTNFLYLAGVLTTELVITTVVWQQPLAI
jgi:hypothetical protein